MSISPLIADQIYQEGFSVIDNFLSHEHYLKLNEMIKTLYHQNTFAQAKIGHKSGKAQNKAIRNDQIFWLDRGDPAVNDYFDQLDSLCALLNQTLFLGLQQHEAHFAVYEPHGFYKKHVDQFTTTQDRRISCVYYLNEAWEADFGGTLKLYNTEDELLTEIMPIGNRFVCFNSNMPHEVSTAYQTRYSIAAWLKVRALTAT